MRKRPRLPQGLHPVEHRPKVRAEAAGNMKVSGIALHFPRVGDPELPLYPLITFQDQNPHPGEKSLLIRQKACGLVEKALHQRFLAGGAGIDGDHQLLDLPRLREFIFLDEGHISVKRQTIAVVAVVKGVRIDAALLPLHGNAPEKILVVRFPLILQP